ncbi:207_t:CDS:2 [Paraglomus brasilianum]|uniref:207_t:CDS:1 n=1 Tax=Paraglomus brasilianum TaxID=144538 RepID=A0A9N9B419_9GLOM|nr:207_t:CDS:2 [Paraglomus brasilianum]
MTEKPNEYLEINSENEMLVISKIQEFIPKIAAANEQLSSVDPGDLDIMKIGEDAEQVIEYDLLICHPENNSTNEEFPKYKLDTNTIDDGEDIIMTTEPISPKLRSRPNITMLDDTEDVTMRIDSESSSAVNNLQE